MIHRLYTNVAFGFFHDCENVFIASDDIVSNASVKTHPILMVTLFVTELLFIFLGPLALTINLFQTLRQSAAITSIAGCGSPALTKRGGPVVKVGCF